MPINWNNVEFKGEKRFLSNMFRTPIKFDSKYQFLFPTFKCDDRIYPSSENLYQSLKFPDWPVDFTAIEPKESKNMSRKFDIREDWEEVKDEAMRLALFFKFAFNNALATMLIATEGHIEEKNDWRDCYWGTYMGYGHNKLGIMLMELRTMLKDNYVRT